MAKVWAFSIVVILALSVPVSAGAAVTWDIVETGLTDPTTNGTWPQTTDDGSGALNAITENLSGTTPRGDNVYMNLTVNTAQKLKVRRDPSNLLNGSGMTVRLIMRMNSGGSGGNWGIEVRDSFGTLEAGYVRNDTDPHGYIELDNRSVGSASATVAGIDYWHEYWFILHPNGNTYFWLDPDSSDNSLATADAVEVAGSGGDRINWGMESSSKALNQDIDDLSFALGVHLPSEDSDVIVIPTLTPTQFMSPTPTPTPTITPTRTPVPNQPAIELSMVRELGAVENNYADGGNRAIYIHLSDEFGGRIDGADCYWRVDGMNVSWIGQTGDKDVTFPDFQEVGFPEYDPQDFIEVRVEYNGVSSDWSPILYRNVPNYAGSYSWELNFVYINDTVSPSNDYYFKPLDLGYDYAHVTLNEASETITLGDPDYFSDSRTTIQSGAASLSYSQSFVPNGNRIVAAKGFMTTEFLDSGGGLGLVKWNVSIHQGSPDGPQVGSTQTTPQYFSFEYPKVTAFWPLDGPDSVPVFPGTTYFIKFTKVLATGGSYSVYHSTTDSYPWGSLYRDGSEVSEDVDVVGVVVTANAWPKGQPTPVPTNTPDPNGTPTPTPIPPASVGSGWSNYR